MKQISTQKLLPRHNFGDIITAYCIFAKKNINKEEFYMNKMSTRTLVMGAVLTALVVLLQSLGAFIKFGPFSISLVLIPIVIGTATCGWKIGTWLGFVFGAMVLATGDAAPFLAVHAWGTVVTVMLKGTLCGLLSGLAFKGAHKLLKNTYAATAVSAVVCPVVNTGIFLLGCLVFFMDTITMWAEGAGLGGDVAHYMIFVLVGANFLVELGANIIFSPIIVRIIKATERA